MTQRQIKFRAWDGERMLDDVPPSVIPLGANAVIQGTTCIIMQFTGLLDKNGKEIYEGDITNYGIISWADGFWEIGKPVSVGNARGKLSHVLGSNQVKVIEIIGNICENEELLKSND